MRRFYELGGVDLPFDPTYRFQTSYLLRPRALGLIRILFSLYAFVTIIVRFANESATIAGQSFSYFTNISYWSIAFYFAFAGFHTLTYARIGRTYLQRWPRILQYLHVLLYSTICVFPFLVTTVYWKLLAPKNGFSSRFQLWSNVSVHALNSVFALFEVALPRTKHFPWIHIIWIVLFLGGYLGVAYITHATEGFYTYDFLDPHAHGTRVLAAYIFGILVGSILLFCIVSRLIALRNLIFEKVFKLDESRDVDYSVEMVQREKAPAV